MSVATLSLILFFISGASALIFETLWQRLMILVFGASAPAITAILTAFFCGIAIGSLLGGKLLARFKNAFVFYAWVELWIGIWGISVPLLLGGMEKVYVLYCQTFEPVSLIAQSFRFVMAIGVVLPATIGMGATIPIMSRLIHELGEKGLGKSVGFAYGVNTVGAVGGCLLAGFYLVPSLGVMNSLITASALNAAVVIGAFILARCFRPATSVSQETSTKTMRNVLAGFASKDRVLILLYFLSSFLALGYEIIWMRCLAILTTNGVHTFTLALSTYLLGFSTGSLVLYPLMCKRFRGATIFYFSNLATGIAVMACIPFLYILPEFNSNFLSPLIAQNRLTLGMLARQEAICCIALMFVPTIFMGIAFPAICQHLIESGQKLGEKSGVIYCIGNLGAMVGIFLTGLTLIPAMGLVPTLGGFVSANFVLALLTLAIFLGTAGTRLSSPRVAVHGVVMIALCVGVIHYAQAAAPITRLGGFFKEDGVWKKRYAPGVPKYTHMARYRSGRSGTISVQATKTGPNDPGNHMIAVDGQFVAGTSRDALIDAKMLAHLPLFLHPAPKRALTVGFGSGATSWSMITHGIDVYAAEIEAEVIRSAHFFESQNYGVLNEKNFTLILNDARDHLHVTTQKYDVISTDATNLQYKQNASLYALEYFRLMKSCLTPDGIACAWIPIRGTGPKALGILLRTFQTVFPHSSFWYMDHTLTEFAILIATPDETGFDPARFRQAFSIPRVAHDLSLVGVEHPYHLAQFMYLDEHGMREWVGDGPLHTDDKPILEFAATLSLYSRRVSLFPMLDRFDRLRSPSYESLLLDADDDERREFSRIEKFARTWGKANVHLTWGSTGPLTPSFLQEGIDMIKEALTYYPEHAWALRQRNIVERDLRNLQDGGRGRD
jgi:spermidine synthase